jgi:hypothetical protein
MVVKQKTTKLPKITQLLEKALLKDIEETGLAFDEIALVQLCNKKEIIYGEPSSEIRRAIQKYFTRLKSRTPKNYNRLLLKYKIVPGPNTFSRLKEAESPPPPEPSITGSIEETSIEEASATDLSIEEASATDLSIEEASATDLSIESESSDSSDIADQLENLSIRSPPAVRPRVEMTTPTKTPIRDVFTSPPRAFTSPPALHAFVGDTDASVRSFASPPVFTSPAPPAGLVGDSAYSNTVDSDAYRLLNFFQQVGTKEQPFIVMVNYEYPERSSPLWTISRLEKVEHINHQYQGFGIRCSIDVPDYLEYEAFIPDPREFQSLLSLYGRIIMIRGPSVPFWLRDDDRYHSDKSKIDCAATKTAHEMETTARKEAGESRLHSYHLLVFKPGTVLDNSIFSSNNTHVIGHQLSQKMEANDAKNVFKQKVQGMTLWWRIAEAGGTKIRNVNSTVDASLLLD